MLTQFQQSKLANLFAMYDSDKDGYITQSDLQRVVDTYAQICEWDKTSEQYKTFQHKFTTIRWQHMLQVADKNNDNQVSLDEYLTYCNELIDSPADYEKEVKGIGAIAFSVFDRNQDEQLSLGEFRDFYRAINLDDALAPTLFGKLSLGDDALISKEQFVTLLDQFFRSQDQNAPGNILFGN